LNIIEIHPAFNGFEQNINNLKGGFLPGNSKIIIMGTFPPKKEYEKYESFFYYPSSQNRFWNIIDEVFENTERPLKFTKTSGKNEPRTDNINRKIEFSLKNKIAFLDFYSKIERKNDTSYDTDLVNIENVVENDILIKYLKVNKPQFILCTYSRAYKELIRVLSNKSYDVKENNKEKKSILTFENSKIEIIQLFPATFRGPKEEIKIIQYQNYLKI